MIFLPEGYYKGAALYRAACGGCGEIIPGRNSSVPEASHFKPMWNKHMELRQAQEGGYIKDDE